MSNAPVDPSEVPVFTGDLDLLETKVKSLSHGGPKVETAGSDVHKSFGGLSAFYKAPEAEQLFGVTKPVADKAHDVGHDARVIAGALGTYAREVRPLVHQLTQLKQAAADFRHKVDGSDDDWREDGDLVEENLARRNKIAEVWAAFQAAERDCHAKIVGLVGGKSLHAIDASHKQGYGYDAETLKESKSLPWGDAVEESAPWWKVWVHAYDFGKGIIIDGAGGGIKALLTLVGVEGGDAAKQAWIGLAKLTTTTALLGTMPALVPMFAMTPGHMLPSWFRDSRTAMLEAGKAFVAWDQWESNGPRAAGAVTFNIITAIITRGGGAAVEGAGTAATAVKALTVAGKVGQAIDPMTYVFKGAGAGLSKLGDVVAHLKNAGHLQIPKISEGAYSLPEGATKLPDGTIHLPKDAAIPEGANKLPDGRIKLPEGTVELPPNTVKDPATGKYMSGRGDLYNEDGSLFQRAEDAHKEQTPTPATDADNPRTEIPARQEQPVLASVGGRGDDFTRVGSDISDPVRTGDKAGHGDTGPGDHSPMGRADDHGAPGGHSPDNMPRNDLNQPPHGGHANSPTTHGTDAPSRGGTHPDTPGTGGTHNPLGGHGPGGFDEIPGFGNDAARAGDGTAPAGGHEDQPTHPASGQQLTPEQVKARQDEFVQKANDPDKTWFDQYYRSDGHRLSIHTKIDGVELPILAKDSDGSWISKNSLPSTGSETKFGRDPFVRDETLPSIDHLDDVAKDRKASVELANAERTHKASPTADTLDELAKAQERFDARMTLRWGENTSNNTSFSERLGEEAARLHVVPERFPGSVEQPLPKTPNGANMFDQLYRRPDGKLMIIEAKAPSSSLLWRKGVGPAEGFMVKQGTEPYLRTIIAEMERRPNLKATDASGKVWTNADLADELTKALDSKNLEYAMVKATDGGSKYAGAVLEFFKI